MSLSEHVTATCRSVKAVFHRLERGAILCSSSLPQTTPSPVQTEQLPAPLPMLLRRRVERAGGPRIPSPNCFRVLFVVIPGISDAACMRYRAYNVMEALRTVEVESECIDFRLVPTRLGQLLAFDLIVLVRRRSSPEVDLLLQFAEQHRIPVICDLDDYLFDEEVLPHSEYLRMLPAEDARALIEDFRGPILKCRYYTGSTPFLMKRAVSLGVSSYLIRNGLNTTQIEMSRIAVDSERGERSGPDLWLGYFSGTLTHQSDFGLVAPVIIRLLEEFPMLGLVVAGDFDLAQFPEFTPFVDRLDQRPFVDWTRLPAEIARVDINLIPLVLSPFTEAKSDLKYYEAAVLKIPSVASPTEVYRACITHGSNGLLASSENEWYKSLRQLITDSSLRQLIGKNAYEHVLQNYLPENIAEQAVCVYRDVLLDHRRRLGSDVDSPTFLVLFADLPRALADRSLALTLCHELTVAGARVTIQIDDEPVGWYGVEQARAAIVDFLGADTELTFQFGGDVPCADVLLATDSSTAIRVWEARNRTQWPAYLVCEYEPARLAPGMAHNRAIRSFELGLDMVVFDPVVADLLASHRHSRITVLPTRIATDPAGFSGHTDPTTLFVVSSNDGVPDTIWRKLALVLGSIKADHPEIRIVLGGQAATRAEYSAMDLARISEVEGAEFDRLLASQPVCVLLCPSGRSPRAFDITASGCPTIVVNLPGLLPSREAEQTRGVIEVQPSASEIARAINSLLIDRIRLGSLVLRATDHVRNLPVPAGAARALLEQFRAVRDTGEISGQQDRTTSPDSTVRDATIGFLRSA
jgi:glycosyltransferase involved in cell wall biosynthesis